MRKVPPIGGVFSSFCRLSVCVYFNAQLLFSFTYLITTRTFATTIAVWEHTHIRSRMSVVILQRSNITVGEKC